MASIPSKITDRISEGLRRLQPVISSAKSRDVNESDTVTIVVDLLSDVFGYDRYSEITREFAIRGTFCDLAIKIEGKVSLLIEVKAIGLELKDNHVRQAVDYAANEGIEWVALTNGAVWQVYRVSFEKPVSNEKVFEVNLLTVNPRKKNEAEPLYILTREGIKKSALEEYHNQRQVMSRYNIGAILLSEPALAIIRREIKRINPDAKISSEEIKEVMMNEVIKREVIEGAQADEASRKVTRAMKRALRATQSSNETSDEKDESPSGPNESQA